jgi:hypothetical protein
MDWRFFWTAILPRRIAYADSRRPGHIGGIQGLLPPSGAGVVVAF